MSPLPLVLALALGQPAPAPRTTVVLSDLHLGAGRDGADWDRYEDFRWAEEFTAFLAALNPEARGPVDLVLAGDAFELWQGRDGRCPSVPERRDLGCSADEALARIGRAIAQHGVELAALQRFAQVPGNRLVVLPGNHDAALLFPAVAEQLARAVPAARLEAKGWWVSEDGLTMVEHGQQIGEPNALNSFEGWPSPFLQEKSWWCFWGSGTPHLRRPWGEQFVVEFYDAWEDRFPVIDNVTEELAGAKLAMKALGVPKTLAATSDLVRFFFFDVSLSQLAQGLGGEGGKMPTWDIARLRQGGDAALAEALPPEDPLVDLLRSGALAPALQNGKLGAALDAFDDAQLRALCDKEHLNREARRRKGEELKLPCPALGNLGGDGGGGGSLGEGDGTLGAAVLALAGGEGRALEKRLRKLRAESGKDFLTYVYGHTHAVREPWMAITQGDWNPYALNDGAWQRVVTPAQVAAFGATPAAAQAFLTRQPEQLPPCYTFAWLPNGQPDARAVRSWRQVNGAWGFGKASECAGFKVAGP